MHQHSPQRLTLHCECGAKLAIPENAAGRSVRCPKCHLTLRAPAQAPTADTPTRPDPAPATRVVQCRCGARIRIPIGRTARCPKCKAVIEPRASSTPPTPSKAESARPAPPQAIPPIAPTTPPAPAIKRPLKCPNCRAFARGDASICLQCGHDLATPVAADPAAPAPICPGCKKTLPAGAKICVACGINLKTGRRLVTSDAGDLDKVYETTEGVVRFLSFFIPIGIYPVASEAFGTRKPWTTRVLAILTCVISAIFLVVVIRGGGESPALDRFALWAGKPQSAAELRAQLTAAATEELSDGKKLTADDIREIDNAIREEQATTPRFEPYQLVTCAFLHSGPIHLAGNMLFLLILGSRVNALIGNIWTAILYPVLAAAAGIAQMVASRNAHLYPMIGASGAVMGLAGMYLVFFPIHQVHMAAWIRLGLLTGFRLHYKAFIVRGIWVVLFYIAFDVFYTALGLKDGVAHWAHLGGFIAGVVLAVLLLLTRRVNARGADIFSAIFGHKAAALVGKPT